MTRLVDAPSLFDLPTAAPRRPAGNRHFIRRSLLRLIAAARAAESCPWSPQEVAAWRVLAADLAAVLPEAEGVSLFASFEAELTRLNV